MYLEHQTDPSKSFEGNRYEHTQMWSTELKQKVASKAQNNLVDKYFRYRLHIEAHTNKVANNVYDYTLNRDIVRYLHRVVGSPVPSTCIKAIDKGNYATWPGLTYQLVCKHLPKSVYTTKGHMR